jgi:glycosyltransferase involved in cell wall biosynthesis
LTALRETNSFDLLQCEWTPYARYLADSRDVPTLIATHNVESQIWFRRSETEGNPFSRWFFRRQAEKMEHFERSVLQRASWVTAVSEEDAQKMRQWSVNRLSVVDNGVDLDLYQTENPGEDDREILFLASLDWEPNIDGLNYFLSDMLPDIAVQRPDVRLTIAGRRPSPELRRRIENLANVNFVGEVQDVRPLLQKAAVVIVPLRVGGGSRLKILEAMAAGKAIVSTSVGAEGLSVQNNVHLQIADTPAEFSSAVLSLMASPETRRRLGTAGRHLVEQKYGWDECANKLESAWFKAVEIGSPSSLSDGKKP